MGKKVGGDSNVIFGRFSSVPLRLKQVKDDTIEAGQPLLNIPAFGFKNRFNGSNTNTNLSIISSTSDISLAAHSKEVDTIQRRLQSTNLSANISVSSGCPEECKRTKTTKEDLVTVDTSGASRPRRSSPRSNPATKSNNRHVEQSITLSQSTTRKSSRLHTVVETEEVSPDTPTKKINPPKRAKKSISPVVEPHKHLSDENTSSIANKPALIQKSIVELPRRIQEETTTKQTNRRGRRRKSKQGEEVVQTTIKTVKKDHTNNQEMEIVAAEDQIRTKAPKKRTKKQNKQNTKESDVALTDNTVMMTHWLSDLVRLNGISARTFAILLKKLCTQGYNFKNVELNCFKYICFHIAQCEHIATTPEHQHHELPHVNSSGRKRPLAKKKQVRFRSFDLSCLSLHYIECDEVLQMVENILKVYAKVNDSIQKLVSTESGRSILYKAIDMLSVNQNYTDHDASIAGEVRLASDFFKEQFQVLLSNSASPLLESVFSPLVSSYCRYQLRVVFLPFEQDQAKEEEDHILKTIKPIEKDASKVNQPYAHQDLGAAIHLALRIYANEKHQLEENHELLDVEAEEVEEVLRHLINAHAFLLFHFNQVLNSNLQQEEEVMLAWGALERVCEMARHLNFEDEAYLFPLGDLSSFLQDLEKKSQAVQKLRDQILEQDIEKEKKAYENLKCGDCEEQICPSEKASSISCNTCSGMYHLRCLDLPMSFQAFASQFTCPNCFLTGRA